MSRGLDVQPPYDVTDERLIAQPEPPPPTAAQRAAAEKAKPIVMSTETPSQQ